MNDIDLIVPWVDGNDPVWQKTRADFLGLDGDNRIIRYRDWGLMKYWFRGVEKYLPWVRKIHFVTFGHMPEGIKKDHPKLNIVNHKDYIPEEYLPTFSSHVIEMNFFRIKDLSEQFIYANDDMFFLRPLNSEFFFKDGLPVDCAIQNILQFKRADGIDPIVANDLLNINMNFSKNSVIKNNISKWFSPKYGIKGILKNLYLMPIFNYTGFVDSHIPYSFLKSTMLEVYQKCEPAFLNTFSHPIRTRDDINQWLFRYWQFATGRFSPGKPNRGKLLIIGDNDAEIKRAITNQSVPMICISDDIEDIDFEKEKQFLIDCFETILPEKSSFEI